MRKSSQLLLICLRYCAADSGWLYIGTNRSTLTKSRDHAPFQAQQRRQQNSTSPSLNATTLRFQTLRCACCRHALKPPKTGSALLPERGLATAEADIVDDIVRARHHPPMDDANLPRDWSTESAYHGLGEWWYSPLPVSQYDILQMLPMCPDGVLHGGGATRSTTTRASG